MATVKALEGRTVHQIQSGQVIVDLCSVVKELVENSLDAGATSIEVRFKDNGLDSIEVQDNGVGIASENYETIALKHYTSKLSSYEDLTSLQTFGFRGEALSSLCALAKFTITTARADEAPKGTRLDFDVSGRLQDARVVASQKGTTVAVENIFTNLPVRRRELEKNIKREYGKALGVLQAYACISTQARISVSNVMAKGKKNVVFATRSSPTTKENIANVFGSKILPGLVTMDLSFEMRPTTTSSQLSYPQNKQVRVIGHVSRTTSGEGRQAPDRQMFFVNARPCALPQVAKIFNEVYKSYNALQSPFVFSNFNLDTNSYDVNVSPDKRTILLHEQSTLLDSLRVSLTELFEKQDQSVPMSQRPIQKRSSLKHLSVHREESGIGEPNKRSKVTISQQFERSGVDANKNEDQSIPENEPNEDSNIAHLIENFIGRDSKNRINGPEVAAIANIGAKTLSKDKQKLVRRLGKTSGRTDQPDEYEDTRELSEADAMGRSSSVAVDDFNERMAEQRPEAVAKPNHFYDQESEKNLSNKGQVAELPSSGAIWNAFDHSCPRRNLPNVATVRVGSKKTTIVLGSSSLKQIQSHTTTPTPITPKNHANDASLDKFTSSMSTFAPPGIELIKTVGWPQSKSRVATDYSGNSLESEVLVGTLSTDPESPDDEDYRQSIGDDRSDAEDLSSHFGQNPLSWDAKSNGGYVEEEDWKAREDAKVAELIKQAEEKSAMPSQDSRKRAHQILKGAGQRDSTAHLIQVIDASVERMETQLSRLSDAIRGTHHASDPPVLETSAAADESSPEERLSLTVSKTDFADMHLSGQFNLGFILATRNNTDLFIIDQHASDEKYNYERLQANTVVQHQRLVKARTLRLTAIQEEIILECNEALLNNGFLVDVDTSGDCPVGQRCKLISLPMSREVTFDITDLEELISLLADSPAYPSTGIVPRPTKVRRMFAMRACRSSIMIGKTLTLKQMESLVRKMGHIDKPWNCPHGRPTMRHVCVLDGFEEWNEGDGLVGTEEERGTVKWGSWHMGRQAGTSGEDQGNDAQIREKFAASEDWGDEEAKTPDE